MRFKHLSLAALGVVLTASGFYASSAIAQDEQFIPLWQEFKLILALL